MNKLKFVTSVAVALTAISVLSACSTMRKMTTFGNQSSQSSQNSSEVAVNEKLTIPPSLQEPAAVTNGSRTQSRASKRQSTANKASYISKKNYYIVVGTYPDQEQALDTFVRLSSIGLPGATMESRVTKSGQNLHMVRLGPYHKQEDIDKVKDSLTSDGLSQFKVVEN